MKKLLFIIALLVSFTFNAQEISETERIVDKYGEKLAQGFSEFMETTTPMAQEGFQVVVKLQYAKGIVNIIGFIICFFVIYKSFIGKLKEWILEETGGALYILLSVPIVAGSIFLYEGLLYLFAPEWFAIKEIAELF